MQLNSIPLKIDINVYKNAHSDANPTGDYKATYLFTELANTIPELTAYYNNSPYLLTDVWDNIINSANSNITYTQQLINNAKEKFNASSMSGMGGIPGNWYPVSANPFNWYDIILDDSNLIQMELDLQSDASNNNSFIVINKSAPLTYTFTNQKNETSQFNLNSNTTIKKIYLSVLRVDFIRPWLDFEILNQQNWKIEGLNKYYFSNGNLDSNKGIFPLLTQSILIGTKVSLEGDFSQKDISEITNHQKIGNSVSLGPFLLNSNNENVIIEQKQENTIISSNIKQVVGYLSRLIPMSPALPST